MNKFISTKSAIVAGLVVAAFALTSVASAYTFSSSLKVGSTGADVKALQQVLNTDVETQVANGANAGAPGYETSYFGPATKAAVVKFQNKYASDILAPVGLTAGTGYVGQSTVAFLNTMGGSTTTTGMVPGCTSTVGFSSTTGASCASGVVTTTSTVPGCTSTVGFSPTTGAKCDSGAVTTTPVTTSGPVSVALAQDNPAASAIVEGQATADLAHFTFTGNGTISTLALQRIGISSNTTLSNVYLYQGNTRVSDGASVNTTGVINFSGLSIAVNGSVTLSVKADIAASTSGQLVGVQLTSFTTTGSTSATTASISGNIMTVAAATLATVSVGTNTSTGTPSVDAGTMGYTFWSSPVSVSTRAVSLKGANFKYIGSAPSDALANIKLYVNGTAVGSNGVVNASTQIISFDFGTSPVTLNTGSATVEVRADIVKGSNRTVQLSLQNAADLVVMDSQLGVNVAVKYNSGTFAVVNGATVTIAVGSVSTTVDTTFNSLTTITSGSTGATIAKYTMKAYGEDIKVSSLSVTPVISGQSGPAETGLNNVALFYNGAQVGSSVAAWATTTGAITFNLGSSMILAAGQTATLEVRADLQGSGASNYVNGTVSANLNLGTNYGQGQNSSSMVNVPTATVTGNSLTIAAGSLSVAQSAGYSGSQTVNPNTTNVKLASYIVSNPSSSEGVRITNLAVAVTVGGSPASVLTTLSNLRTTETSGSGSTPINPAATNNFSVNFTLAPGQTKTIDVMVDLGSAVAGNTYTTTLLPTAVGASSNATLTPGSATAGQTLTVQTGSVSAVPTLNPAPASLSAQFVVGGSQNLAVASYNFVATNGTATISELKFLVTGGTSAATSTPVTQVCVGGVCAPVVNNVAHLTGLAISVPAGSAGANVAVQASFSSVGTNGILSNTTAILNLTFMKYTIGGVTTSTLTGTVANLGVSSGTPADIVSGVASTLTMTSTNTPLKVGMVISSIGATTTPITTLGGLGTITAVASDTAATVAWATSTTIGASAVIQFFTASSSALTMVGTKPTVSIAASTDQLTAGSVKLAEFTVAADAAGSLKLVNLPISVTTGGTATTTTAADALVVKGADGTTITTTSLAMTIGAGLTGTSTITFGTGYTIAAGTSKTFRVYLEGAGLVGGAVNTASLSTKLGAASLLTWNDLVGGVDGITGALIYNYPTDTSTIHN